MFTGIIRDKGIVTAATGSSGSVRLKIQSRLSAADFQIGASVACNGVCLTVCEIATTNETSTEFLVDVGPETLAASRFGNIKIGDLLHLEPALRAGDSMGGHNVTGHVDGTAKVVQSTGLPGGFWKLILAIPEQWSVCTIAKGSIAVAGVSLTIAHVNQNSPIPKTVLVEIMLVPHTLLQTCLGFLQAGDEVEIECDATAKMVASVVTHMLNSRVYTNNLRS